MSSGLPAVALGIILWGLHLALTHGVLTALIADVAPEDLRGTAYGLFYLGTGLALPASSVMAGALWEAFGPVATFMTGAGFAGLSLADYQ